MLPERLPEGFPQGCQKRPGGLQSLPAASVAFAVTRVSLQSGPVSSTALGDTLSGASWDPAVAPSLLNCARRHDVRSVVGAYNRVLPPQWRLLARVGAYNRALPPRLRSATRCQEHAGSLQSLPASSIALADTLLEASWEPTVASCHLAGFHCRAREPTIGICVLNCARWHAVRGSLWACSRSLPPRLRSSTRC